LFDELIDVQVTLKFPGVVMVDQFAWLDPFGISEGRTILNNGMIFRDLGQGKALSSAHIGPDGDLLVVVQDKGVGGQLDLAYCHVIQSGIYDDPDLSQAYFAGH
jgi:hypothetical protein